MYTFGKLTFLRKNAAKFLIFDKVEDLNPFSGMIFDIFRLASVDIRPFPDDAWVTELLDVVLEVQNR